MISRVAVSAVLLGGIPASAQTAASTPPPAVTAGQDGFVIQSADGDFRLQIGLLVQADGRFVSYRAGLMNGVPDGGSADLDTNDGKDVSGRFIVRPFNKIEKSPLSGLYFAISGSTGRQEGTAALPTFRTQSLEQQYFSYNGASA